MTDIAPKRNGIIAISALFGLLAAVVALFAFAYSVLGAILIGLIVAVIVAIILWMSWQDTNSGTASDVTTAAAATSSAAARTDATATAVSPAAANPAAAKAAAKPAVLAKARDGGADNLKMIKGVGPVLEKALHTKGVFHFDQVGAWSKADAEWFDDNVKGANGRVIRDGWVKQAKILAKGGTTEFSVKVKKGGVY